MHLNKIQDAIIEEFETIFDKVKNKFKYFRYFAKMGSALPSGPSIMRSTEKLIKLTKSQIWLDAEYRNGKVYYSGDSDSKIMKGILLLYLKVFSGRTPNEIIDSDIYFTHEIDLLDNLSAERLKEISTILVRIRSIAAGYKANTLKKRA